MPGIKQEWIGMDGWVPVSEGEAIVAAFPASATLYSYPTLGHALSTTKVLAEDSFDLMETAPLEDLVSWISRQN